MNERIRELAEQAGLKYYNWSTIESNIIDGDFKYPRLEDYKKFAELIVKEILQTCEDHPAWTGRMIGEQIKQHFGVEE
jgi:hypothetical protein